MEDHKEELILKRSNPNSCFLRIHTQEEHETITNSEETITLRRHNYFEKMRNSLLQRTTNEDKCKKETQREHTTFGCHTSVKKTLCLTKCFLERTVSVLLTVKNGKLKCFVHNS